MKFKLKPAATLAALSIGLYAHVPTHAHVVLEHQVAQAGAPYKASFKVGHGCGTSSTRQIAVDIPVGVRGTKPMPKPGWTLDVQRVKLAQPYTSHGRTVTEDVVRVVWTAKSKDDMLPHTQYDEFVLSTTMPDKAGPMYWPVRQLCEEGSNLWVEVPQAGQKMATLTTPAALLEVMPADAQNTHQH